MTPFYTDDWLTLYGGDCKAVLAELPADSVDCVVTSPPYWGLRDYGTASWSGGDEECDHKPSRDELIRRAAGASTLGGRSRGEAVDETMLQKEAARWSRSSCPRCGATRQDSQLGLERTPEEYVANMVAVFAEIRRVLKPSGTCWLNLGDSYAAQTNGGPAQSDRTTMTGGRKDYDLPARSRGGLKPKDLVGIPWRVAFALQADGWYLRSDIIWSKPNPMPESVTDRPTKAHEYLFLLTKSARYYFDADAVREADSGQDHSRRLVEPIYDVTPNAGPHTGIRTAEGRNGTGRNIRSVWTIATRPYPGAHFAVFPPELPERCIKAGSSERGVCPECGAPWERVVERTGVANDSNEVLDDYDVPGLSKRSSADRVRRLSGATYQRVVAPTNTWRPTCDHRPAELACTCNTSHRWCLVHSGTNKPPMPAVILDPFAGSGTVGMVANRLSRRAILIDLNPEYLVQQMERNAQTPLGLTEGDAA